MPRLSSAPSGYWMSLMEALDIQAIELMLEKVRAEEMGEPKKILTMDLDSGARLSS